MFKIRIHDEVIEEKLIRIIDGFMKVEVDGVSLPKTYTIKPLDHIAWLRLVNFLRRNATCFREVYVEEL